MDEEFGYGESEDEEDEDMDGSAATTPESKTSKPDATKRVPERKNSDLQKILNQDEQEGSSQHNPIELDQTADVVQYATFDINSDEEEQIDKKDKGKGRADVRTESATHLQSPTVETSHGKEQATDARVPSPPTRPQHPWSVVVDGNASHNAQVIHDRSLAMKAREQETELYEESADEDDESTRSQYSYSDEEHDFEEELLKLDTDNGQKDAQPRVPPFQRTPSPSDAALATRRALPGLSEVVNETPVYPYGPHPAYIPYQPAGMDFAPVQPSGPSYYGAAPIGYSLYNQPFPDPPASYSRGSTFPSAFDPYPAPPSPVPSEPLGGIDLTDAQAPTDAWDVPTSVASNVGSTKASEAVGLYDKMDGDTVQESRINISNLINAPKTANELETGRALKRKADEMTAGDEVEASAIGSLIAEDSDSEHEEMDWSHRPYPRDIQSPSPLQRDPSPYPESEASVSSSEASEFNWKAEEEKLLLEGLNAPVADLQSVGKAADSAQSQKSTETPVVTAGKKEGKWVECRPHVPQSTTLPAQLPARTSAQANSTHQEEPARKKVKTCTASRLGGVAKFLAGAAVGAAGLLGGIIAMTPDSVKEEALREMAMGAI